MDSFAFFPPFFFIDVNSTNVVFFCFSGFPTSGFISRRQSFMCVNDLINQSVEIAA